MDISVARRAGAELQSAPVRLLLRTAGNVALHAFDLGMRAGQRELGLAVIEG